MHVQIEFKTWVNVSVRIQPAAWLMATDVKSQEIELALQSGLGLGVLQRLVLGLELGVEGD